MHQSEDMFSGQFWFSSDTGLGFETVLVFRP